MRWVHLCPLTSYNILVCKRKTDFPRVLSGHLDQYLRECHMHRAAAAAVRLLCTRKQQSNNDQNISGCVHVCNGCLHYWRGSRCDFGRDFDLEMRVTRGRSILLPQCVGVPLMCYGGSRRINQLSSATETLLPVFDHWHKMECTVFYILSTHNVLFAHPLLRPKVMWEDI